MTSTTISPIPQLSILEETRDVLPIYYCYTIFGILAFLVNLIIVVVYFSNNSLRTKFTMYAGLAVADMINGLGFAVTGFERVRVEFSLVNVYIPPITNRYECAVQVGNILQVIGSQWPAMITLSLGLERFFAVQYPIKYRQLKLRMFHGLLITSFIICLISISVAMYIGVVVQRFMKASFTCNLSYAYGFEYTTFNYFMTMIGHIVGFFLNITAFKIVRETAKKSGFYNKRLSKEYKKVKIILFVSMLSLIMVVLPNFFLYISRFIEGGINYLILGWTYCFFVLRSIFNIWVIGFGVEEFETRFLEIFVPCTSSAGNRTSVEDNKTALSLPDRISQKKNVRTKPGKIPTIS